MTQVWACSTCMRTQRYGHWLIIPFYPDHSDILQIEKFISWDTGWCRNLLTVPHCPPYGSSTTTRWLSNKFSAVTENRVAAPHPGCRWRVRLLHPGRCPPPLTESWWPCACFRALYSRISTLCMCLTRTVSWLNISCGVHTVLPVETFKIKPVFRRRSGHLLKQLFNVLYVIIVPNTKHCATWLLILT